MRKTKSMEWVAYVVLTVVLLTVVIPFLLLLSASLTEESSITRDGYSLLPKVFSMDAYTYIFDNGSTIFRSYGITILVTVVGTLASLIMTSMYAYVASRRDFPMSKFFSTAAFFTMLFSGGLVPTYLVYTQLLNVKNTLWALLVPTLLMSGYNVLLASSFYRNSVPPAVLESARIDGAGEFKIFSRIVLPLSKPIMTTIALFTCIAYWNDWMNGMIYLTDSKLYSIQNVLNTMINDIQFLTQNAGRMGQMSMADLPSQSVKMAIAIVGILPILVAYPFFQNGLVKGIMLGAVKE